MLYAKISNGEAIAFPYSDYALMQDNKNVSFPADLDDETRAEYGMVPVVAAEVPAGKVSTITTAELVDGVWTQVHALEDRPLEDMKAEKRAAINAKLNAVLTGGYTVQSGAMAGKVLQTRNLEDRTNWLTSQASYSIAVAQGAGAVEGATFRTADNLTFTMSYAEGLAILMAMAAWGAAAMNNSWTLKDAVAVAVDQAALDAIDIDAGWPA
jgi:hypothetical protein